MTSKRPAPLWVTLCLVAGLWHGANGAIAAPASPSEELLRASHMWWAKGRADLARQMLEKLLVIEPDSAAGLAAMGELWVREGKVDKAVQILQTMRTSLPRHPATRDLAELVRVNTSDAEKLANMRLLARAGRRAEAADLARDLFPQGSPPALGGLALEYFQIVGSGEKATGDAVRQLERLHAETGDVSYRVAQIEIELGRGSRGQLVLPAVESLSGLREVNVNVLRNLWQRALEQTSGSPAVQISRLQRYLARFPDDSVMVERLAALQQTQERALRAARDPAYLARTAALAALEQGQLPVAEAELLKVLALKPKDPDSLGNLGLVRLRQGQHEQALTLFEQAFRQTGQRKWQELQATARFWGLLRQTDMAVDARDLDTAAELAQKAVTLQPDSPEALVALADVRKLQAKFPVSENLYQQALKQRPDHTAALKGLADVLSKQGRTAQALEWLDKAVRAEPKLAIDLAYTRAEMLSEQADANLQAKRPSEALRALEAAVLLRPDDPWMRHRLAKIYVQLGLPGFAKGVMDEGIERQGSDPAMRHARALVRSAVDDDRGALEDLSHIPASGRSDGMNAMVRRAVVKQMVAQAQPPDVGGRGAELLQLAEQRAGGDPDLLQSVANAWGRLGKPEQGLAVVERLMAGQSASAPDRDLLLAQWLNRALQDDRLAVQLPALMQRADWSDPQLSDLLAIYGEHQERLIERSQAGGDAVAAKRLAQVFLPNVSDGVLKEKTRARLLMAAAEYPDAAIALTRVLQTQPSDSDARFDLGTALVRVGRLPEAREQAEWLKAHLPAGDGGAQLSLLRLWQRLGDVAQARALSEQLIERVRPRVQAQLNAESPPDVAAVDRSRQWELDSDVLVHAARLERSEGQYAKAMALFSDAIKLDRLGASLSVNASPTSGGIDATEAPLALRLTRDAPRHVAVVLAAADAGAGAPADRIRREMDAIDARLQSWVEVGQKSLNKPSTSGISTLNGWERAAVAWFPRGYEGKYFVHIDQVQLNAGGLPVSRQAAEDYGQVAAWPVGLYPTSGAVQRGTATHAGVGFVADRRSWDLGVTGVGFPVTNWVGGYERNGTWSPGLGYRWGLSRRPLTGSLLSYAGARDPITGQVWGGVVATGGSLRLSGDMGPVGVSFTARHDVLTGRNVLSNQRTQFRWSADKDIWQTPQQVVNAGLSLGLTRHARDLSEYSWGHGGYYSPQRLLSLSVPAEWSGREGAWAWLVRGALSWSSSSSARTAVFPAHPVLQNQAGNRFYSASRGTGLGIAARAAVEHQTTRNWVWGAQLELERSDAYSPTHFLLYARYLLDPVRAPLENRPRPVQLYSEF